MREWVWYSITKMLTNGFNFRSFQFAQQFLQNHLAIAWLCKKWGCWRFQNVSSQRICGFNRSFGCSIVRLIWVRFICICLSIQWFVSFFYWKQTHTRTPKLITMRPLANYFSSTFSWLFSLSFNESLIVIVVLPFCVYIYMHTDIHVHCTMYIVHVRVESLMVVKKREVIHFGVLCN